MRLPRSIRNMKLLTIALVLLSSLMILSCAESKESKMRQRYEDFRNILPSAVKVSIDSKDVTGAVIQIDSLIKVDSAFAASWEEIKKSEAIQLFSTTDVLDYYATYFAKYGLANYGTKP